MVVGTLAELHQRYHSLRANVQVSEERLFEISERCEMTLGIGRIIEPLAISELFRQARSD